MSKKIFNVFFVVLFLSSFCFIGCTDLLAPKAQTDINLNIDLSKIIKSTRNTGETQSSVSLGENPTIKVAIYDAKKYNATTNSTDNLDLITEAQAKIVNNEAKVKLNNIPVGIDAIVFAELSFTDENSTEVMYAGNSEVFKVKASDNKVSLILKKVANSETSPDDTNTPYEKFTLFQKNSDGKEVTDITEASIETSSTAATKVIVKNPQSSDSVWTYFVKPENNTRFTESANYKVSVELKADKTTVVGIAAARADYFFTVNSDWTPCEFNTGYLIGNKNHQFTIGLGLSSEIEIKNLKIEKLETTYTTEPSLVFDISKDAIETYLKKTDKAIKIIDVSKLEGNAGYNITINTPMCHSTGNSTGTDDSYIQDVKLHLRSYATKYTGANNVSFNITNNGGNDFETSVMADTANKKSISWNNNPTKISENIYGNFSVDFPNYEANDELIVDLITSSTSTSQNNSTSFTLSNFKVGIAEDSLFSDKIFAIQIDKVWTKIDNGYPISKEVTICKYKSINFDVVLFNKDVWDETRGTINDEEKAWKEATRFFYTDVDNIPDGLTYKEEYDDSRNPKFEITNNSNEEEKTVKISLNENYEVVIEEVYSSVNYLKKEDLSSNFDGYKYKFEAGEYCVIEDLELDYPIQIDASNGEVKLYANSNFKITCSSSFPDGTDNNAMIALPESAGTLTLGGGDGNLTIDGGNVSGMQTLISVNSDSILNLQDNCTITNGNVLCGAVSIVGGTFNMTGGTIENNTTTSYCSGIYTMGGTTNINGGTIRDNIVNDVNKGASIYCTGGTVNVLEETITTGTHYTKNIVNGEPEDVATSGGGNATQSITTFSALRSAIDVANTNSSSYTLEKPCVIYIGDSFSTDVDTASTLTISTHVKLVANNTDGMYYH